MHNFKDPGTGLGNLNRRPGGGGEIMGNYSFPLDGVLHSSCPLGMCGILYLLLLLAELRSVVLCVLVQEELK